jgi:hypothetical protein
MQVKEALLMKEQALQKRATATNYSTVRKDFALGEAFALDDDSRRLLTPAKPLKRGLGDEIIPPASLGHAGLEETLKEPDLLDCDATIKRTRLADEAGVFELAIEAAESAKAKGSVQKMISHQLAAAHHHSMRLLAEADKQRDPLIKCKLMNTSTRLMEAFAKGATTLQKLQTGANQIVTVKHVSVNGQAVIDMGR